MKHTHNSALEQRAFRWNDKDGGFFMSLLVFCPGNIA
jgi:hypothetical protein